METWLTISMIKWKRVNIMMTNFKFMKEQQKQHLIDMMKSDEELGLYDETLEAWVEGFADGAKWQAERMYSEEDMLKSFMAGIKCESNKGSNFEQFINQFKNK